jgi:hypothetical protein
MPMHWKHMSPHGKQKIKHGKKKPDPEDDRRLQMALWDGERLRLERELAQRKQAKLELSEQERNQRIQRIFNARRPEEGRQAKLDRLFGQYIERQERIRKERDAEQLQEAKLNRLIAECVERHPNLPLKEQWLEIIKIVDRARLEGHVLLFEEDQIRNRLEQKIIEDSIKGDWDLSRNKC